MKKRPSIIATGTLSVLLSLVICVTIILLQSKACAQTVKIQHMIFDDDWRNDWSDGSEKCKTNPKYDEWILNGSYALATTLEKGGALIFKRGIPLDVRNYTGIAGYINGGSSGKQLIGVCVIDHNGARKPNNIGLDLRKYTQGGSLPTDDWKLFTIPFSHFGDLPKGIKGICFVNAGTGDADTFCLDDFGLVDFAIATKNTATANLKKSVQEKPKPPFYVFADKCENGWQNWSWQCDVNDYTKSCHSGKVSLFAGQEVNGALAFGTRTPFQTKGYSALEFYVNGLDSDNQELRVVLFDGSQSEIRRGSVEINNKKYIEGGSLAVNEWKKVRIPLSSLKATDTYVAKIAIINNSSDRQAFIIDDVVFVK